MDPIDPIEIPYLQEMKKETNDLISTVPVRKCSYRNCFFDEIMNGFLLYVPNLYDY